MSLRLEKFGAVADLFLALSFNEYGVWLFIIFTFIYVEKLNKNFFVIALGDKKY